MPNYTDDLAQQTKCKRCGKLKTRVGCYCENCLEIHNQYGRETKQYFRDIGICPNCCKNKLYGSEKQCLECRTKGNAYAAKKRAENRESYNAHMREYHKKQYEQRKANGECVRCGKKLNDTRYFHCETCRSKLPNRYTGIRAERVLNGLCTFCGEPQYKNYKVCEKHYQMELDICKKRKRRVDGYVTDKELTDLLEDYAGVKVTAEWLKEIRSKKSEVENG